MLACDGILPPGFVPDDPTLPVEPGFGFVCEGDVDIFADSPREEDAELGLPVLPGDTTTVFGKFHEVGDKDVFEIVPLSGAGHAELNLAGPGMHAQLSVVNADGEAIQASEAITIPADAPEGPPPMSAWVDFRFEDPDQPLYLVVEPVGETVGDYTLLVSMDLVDDGGGNEEGGGGGPVLGEDRHSGSLDETATELVFDGVDVFVEAAIQRDADSDAFRFVAQRDRTFVDAFGEIPIVLQIFDSAGNPIESETPPLPSDPDSPDMFLPAFADFATNPGEQYFIVVGSTKGQVGNYHMMVNTYDEPEPELPDSELGTDIHGDTLSDGTELDLSDGFATVFTNIDSADDVDVFTLDIGTDHPESEHFLFVDAFGELPLTLRVLDEGGEPIPGHDEFEFDPELLEPLPVILATVVETGRYHVEVSGAGDGTGTYRLNIGTDPGGGIVDPPDDPGIPVDPPPPTVDAPLGEDVHGDTPADATKLELADTLLAHVYSNIDTPTDRDVFAVPANGSEIYFDVSSLNDGLEPDVEVLDADGNEIEAELRGFNMNGEDQTDEMPVMFVEGAFRTQPGDTYFVSVGGDGGIGEYQINVFSAPLPPEPVFRADSEKGDDIHSAELDSATKLFGDSVEFAEINSWIDTSGDVDIFVFNAHSEILFIEGMSFDGTMPVTVEVLDADGNPLETPEFLGNGEPSLGGEVRLEPGSKYYVSVSSTDEADAEGGYIVQLFHPLIDPDLPPIDPPVIVDPPLFEPHLPADAELGDDIHPDDTDEATPIGINEDGTLLISSNVDHVGDVDAFEIAGTGETFAGELGGFGATEMVFTVFDSDGEQIATAAGWSELIFDTEPDKKYFLTAHSTGDDPGQYFAALRPFRAVVEPVDPTDPDIGVEPGGPGPVEPNPVDPLQPPEEDGNLGATDEQRALETADVNGDGAVEVRDFLVLSSNYGLEVDAAFADGDLDGDGDIDMEDFLILSRNFGA